MALFANKIKVKVKIVGTPVEQGFCLNITLTTIELSIASISISLMTEDSFSFYLFKTCLFRSHFKRLHLNAF